MKHGFVRVAAAVPHVRVADCFYNITQIEQLMRKASEQQVEVVVFPELSITSSTCGDLFTHDTLLRYAIGALTVLVENTRDLNMLAFVGLPVKIDNQIFNVAAAFTQGEVLGLVPKYYLSESKGIAESRWFSSAADIQSEGLIDLGYQEPCLCAENLVFDCGSYKVAAVLGSDLQSPLPVGTGWAAAGAQIIVNLDAQNELAGRYDYMKKLMASQSGRTNCGYVYSSAGYGESTTDLVHTGHAVIAENGVVLTEAPRFTMDEQLVVSEINVEALNNERQAAHNLITENLQNLFHNVEMVPFELDPMEEDELLRTIDAHPFIPTGADKDERCEEIISIQQLGLAKRLEHIHAQTAVIGISGGLDSTLALLITVMTFDALGLPRKNIYGITMPGFGTTDRTYQNAVGMIKALGVTFKEISIKDACLQHFAAIGQDPEKHDVTYENSQARERTQILMDFANRVNGLLVGTGDLSELALGWATYNGDHMSMYGVNADIPKTLVQHLVRWIADHKMGEEAKGYLYDVIDTPISPELIPAATDGTIKQKTEDVVGPYELHDFFLYHFLRKREMPAKIYYLAQQAFKDEFDNATIKKWLYTFFRRFFMQQFKRSCLPDGPKVGTVGISPRGDWMMPSDAISEVWLEEIEALD